MLALIDRLVDRLADEVHSVDVPEADLLEESSWYQNARTTRRKVLLSALAKPPRLAKDRGPHLRSMELLDTASARLADRLAHTPFVILVEDREADGVFLDTIVEELGWPELRTLWVTGRQVTPPATRIETAGGKDAIPKRVQRVVADAASEDRPHRLFVLCDSDAKWPDDDDQELADSIGRVREACATHGVPHHVWRKRTVENYVPAEVFEDARNDPQNTGRAERFDALLRRSKAQRDHFPLKDGLTSAERQAATAAGLYSAGEEADLLLLEQRLFPKRPRLLLRLHSERRGFFTADGLLARDGEGELDDLLLAIAAEL